MKRIIPSVLLALAIVAMLSMNTNSVVQAQPSDHGDHAEGSLHDQMEGVKVSFKALGGNFRTDGSNEEALKHIADLQKYILAAKLLAPEVIEEMPESQQAAAKLDFRRRLAEVLIDLSKVEIHLIDGDRDKAREVIAGSLKEKRNAGHDIYKEEDE